MLLPALQNNVISGGTVRDAAVSRLSFIV